MQPFFSRRTVVAGMGAIAALGTTRIHAASRPNILVAFNDEERFSGHLPVLSRSNLARVTDTAISFAQHTVTNPVCSPSRGVTLTGLYSYVSGVTENVDGLRSGPPLDARIPNLGSVSSAAGYDAGYFGKWHLGTSDVTDLTRHRFVTSYVPKNQNNGMTFDDPTAQQAADWTKARDGSRPWFAMVSFVNPHDIGYPQTERRSPRTEGSRVRQRRPRRQEGLDRPSAKRDRVTSP